MVNAVFICTGGFLVKLGGAGAAHGHRVGEIDVDLRRIRALRRLCCCPLGGETLLAIRTQRQELAIPGHLPTGEAAGYATVFSNIGSTIKHEKGRHGAARMLRRESSASQAPRSLGEVSSSVG